MAPTKEYVDEKDWRNVAGILSKVKFQGECGCCWAIAATGALESHYNIKDKCEGEACITLSPQDLINNLLTDQQLEEIKDELDKMRCYGLSILEAYTWIMENGCVTEDMCPFVGKREKHTINRQPKYRLETFKEIENKNMKIEVDQHPIAAIITATSDLHNLQADEIYYGPKSSKDYKEGILHTVLVVGYGKLIIGIGKKRRQEKYWIIKNSWGEGWSDHGYGRISQSPYIFKEIINDKEVNCHVSLLEATHVTTKVVPF